MATDKIDGSEGRRTMLADLYRAPYTLRRPLHQKYPFVLASPHSGRHYPDSFIAASLLAPPELRRSEDAYADLLFDGAAAAIPMIAARFPRAFLDANRRPDELDPAMFEEPPPGPAECTAHVSAGFGIIPKIVREGSVINRYRLAALDAEERIEKLYRPYHCALRAAMEQTRDRFGYSILIDCHTMPAAPGVADIVVGDRFGTSAPTKLIELTEKRFAGEGFSVARNVPFAGGLCTSLYADPQAGFFALQIEISRALYLNEETVTPNGKFESVRARIGKALRFVVSASAERFGLSNAYRPLAAE